MEKIDITGLNKAEVLAALYNKASTPGFFSGKETMTLKKAEKILDSVELTRDGRVYFDYLNGRVLKVYLDRDLLRTALYDRDNGTGAAYAAIKHLFDDRLEDKPHIEEGLNG
jgi:hypothetical protein